MNGTPFSEAWKAACSAGQVASFMRIAPARIAAVKRGAGPNSPRLTAEVSSVSTQPAPISRSACRLEVGSAIRCSRLTPRRISARVAAIGTPELSRGTASMQPSVIGASASSRERAIVGTARILWAGRCCAKWASPSVCPSCPLATGQELENNVSMQTLKEKLAAERFVITAEIAPPVSCDRAPSFSAKARRSRAWPTRSTSPTAPARVPHLGAVAAAAMLVREGIEPILQLTCRDRNRIALQSDCSAPPRSASAICSCCRATIPSRAISPTPSRCSTTTPRR